MGNCLIGRIHLTRFGIMELACLILIFLIQVRNCVLLSGVTQDLLLVLSILLFRQIKLLSALSTLLVFLQIGNIPCLAGIVSILAD